MCRRKHHPTGDSVSVHAPGPPQEALESDGTRTSRLTKPCPNLDDAGPIVCRLMGLPVASGCDTARDRNLICSDTPSTAMQYPRPLCHSEGLDEVFRGLMAWAVVERVESKFLCVHITKELTWSTHTHIVVKRAQWPLPPQEAKKDLASKCSTAAPSRAS